MNPDDYAREMESAHSFKECDTCEGACVVIDGPLLSREHFHSICNDLFEAERGARSLVRMYARHYLERKQAQATLNHAQEARS